MGLLKRLFTRLDPAALLSESKLFTGVNNQSVSEMAVTLHMCVNFNAFNDKSNNDVKSCSFFFILLNGLLVKIFRKLSESMMVF